MSLRVTSTGCSVVFKFNILSELILQVLISILALKLGIFGVVDKFCRKFLTKLFILDIIAVAKLTTTSGMYRDKI